MVQQAFFGVSFRKFCRFMKIKMKNQQKKFGIATEILIFY